jgi:hypothetical protein
VDGHKKDNWSSQKFLVINWTHGDTKPAMPYGGKEPTMPEGGSAAAASSRAESRAGGIMTAGGNLVCIKNNSPLVGR